MNKKEFPFSAIIGQDEFKLALILAVIDPSIGGVLAIGDKGTGKTTLIRSLAALLSRETEFPFINLPIGASEDRVLGSIHLSTLINEKKEEVQPGLLNLANGGILYVDEINLLNDYLMDNLLDASASGNYFLEREGISKKMDSKFCLIGSMNPEEGALRPQLMDRFGLSIEIRTPENVSERSLIVQSRLFFDDDPETFLSEFEADETRFYEKIKSAKERLSQVSVAMAEIEFATQMASTNNVEGMRADILLIKTARAYAAWHGAKTVEKSHIEAISNFVLAHRKKDTPNKNNRAKSPENKPGKSPTQSQENSWDDLSVHKPKLPANSSTNKAISKSTKSNKGVNKKGVGSKNPKAKEESIDTRKTVGQYIVKDTFEVIHKSEQAKSKQHLILLLDSSGSMRNKEVVAYAKGYIQNLLQQNKSKYTLFSLISIHDGKAHALTNRSNDSAAILNELEELPTGGKTNVIEAFKILKSVAGYDRNIANELVFLTDGKFGESKDIQNAAIAFKLYAKRVNQTTLVDTDQDPVQLNLVKDFSKRINVQYETLEVSA